MVKQLKDYQLQENVFPEFVKIAVGMTLEEQTKFVKTQTKMFPLSAIQEAAFFNTHDKNKI